MKRFLLYLISFICICFIIPIMFTKKNIITSVSSIENEVIENNLEEQKEEYKYNKYGTIRLLHTDINQVEEVSIDEYLYNVVSAEMPASYEKEALKAQSIVARTYTVYKILNKKHDDADICDNSTCCQAWISKEDRLARWDEKERHNNWNKICEAVDLTKGMIVTYNNQPINAFFHSNSGGTTEEPVNVWGGSNFPYLQSVSTSGEDTYSQYASEVIFTKEQLIEKLKEKYSDIVIDFSKEDLKILEYTDSGRVKTVKFGNHELSGVETRTLLGLKSANFEIIKDKDNIKFSVKGYGHGVGMSQTGADSLAKEGKNAEDIIKHFYKDVEIKDINSL